MTTAVPAPPTVPRRPLAGFLPTFGWGLHRVVRWRKVLLVGAVAIGLGVLIGLQIRSWAEDPAKALAVVLNRSVLSFGLPVLALLLAGEGFAYEVQAKTLVYHLVRPVRRTTLFLARFLAGYVPAAAVAALALAALVVASGVTFPLRAWIGIAVTAVLGMFALSAIYYTLGTLFKNGFVVGLVYTFFIETALSSVPGAMQRYSVMYHVRSLAQWFTEGVLPTVSSSGRNPMFSEELMKRIVVKPDPASAVLHLAIVTTLVLIVGAWHTSRRDFPLK